MKAVIPAAGLGTRMRPLTRAVPKELLPAGRAPVLQRVVEELVASGVTSICIVTRPGKPAIREHFAPRAAGGGGDELDALLARCTLAFADQPEPRGLGDALLQARDFVGAEPFLMAIPDQLLAGDRPAAAQLLERWRAGPAIWSSLVSIPAADLALFPGARGYELVEPTGDVVRIRRLRDDDETRAGEPPGQTTHLRGFGRTVFPPAIFDLLGPEYADPRTGEVDLLRTFRAAEGRFDMVGVRLRGRPLDVGTLDGYLRFLPSLLEHDA